MKSKSLRFLIFFIAVLGVQAHSSEKRLSTVRPRRIANVTSDSTRTYWNWVQIGFGAMFDSEGGLGGITGINWTPTFGLSSKWRLKTSIGGLLGNVGTGAGFFMGEGVLSLIYVTNSPYWFEGGGGYQYWSGRRNWHPQLRAGMGMRLAGDLKHISESLHTLYFSYTHAPLDLITVHQMMFSLIFRI